MEAKPIRIMLIEDSLSDLSLIKEMLKGGGVRFELSHSETLASGLEQLAESTFDVILVDLGLPDSWGLETFTRVYACAPDSPIIVLTGLTDDAVAAVSVREGAQDYLEKWSLSANLLVRSIRYAIERKRTERALRNRERYFRSLLFQMHEDILVIDRDYRIADVNKDSLTSTGHTRGDLVGRTCYEVLRCREEPCSLDGESCMLDEVFRTHQPGGSHHDLVRANGSKVTVDILFSPLRDEEGNVTHVIQALRDVTHELKLEQQLRQAQKMQAIGTLAGGIAHDFNNILGIILGYIELSLMGIPEDDLLYANLEHAMNGCHRAKDLVKQILAFSRQVEQDLKPIRLNLIIRESLKLLRAALPSDIEIHQNIEELPEGWDTVMADPTQMHQILMNLCTNAAHAMRDKGGILDVSLASVSFSPDDILRPLELKPGSYVLMTVSDTGSGMDQATMARLFEPYFTTKRKDEGTGLGLAVVHGIVESHGGAIRARSMLGLGSTFFVHLPKTPAAEAETKVERGSELPGGRERILLVDDEEGLLRSGQSMLELLGYEVTAVRNGIDALKLFRARPDEIDLIVTDQTMPKMSGMALARECMRIRADLPVILCTGFSEAVTPERARDEGIRELLLKPLMLSEVATAIRRALC